MGNFTATLCLTLTVLIGSEVRGSDLPPCPMDQTKRYHNCFGTYNYPKPKYPRLRNKMFYRGEFWDDRQHGQGQLHYDDGTVLEGIWE